MRIAVYGASGFTGSLVVAESHRREIETVLVGRDRERLRRPAVEAGMTDAEIRVADLADCTALTAAFSDCAAVVNCAGPFARWGAPVVHAAIAAGAHYVDTTGEQGYLKRVFDTFGADAENTGVSVVPAMADDGGPGDLIAALVAGRATPVDELLIADLRLPSSGASRGTARSMAFAQAESPLEYADGTWVPVTSSPVPALVPPYETTAVPLTVFPIPGVITIPRHVPAQRVRGAVRSELAGMLASFTPDIVDSVPERLPPEVREKSRWLMLAQATGTDGSQARGWVTGPDSYGLTAVIAVEAARRLAGQGAPAGVLAPAQAFDPADFLNFLSSHGVVWQVV